jgi:hypothetical protein
VKGNTMTNSTFDVAEIADDLDFETASKFAPAPATSPTSAPAAAVPATSAQIKTLNWGTAVALPTGDSLTRLKVESKHESLRFALLPGLEAFSVQGHYLALSGKDPRMWLCTGTPACPGCRSGNRGKWSTVAFAVAYENADRTTGAEGTAEEGEAVAEVQSFCYEGIAFSNHVCSTFRPGLCPAPCDARQPCVVDVRKLPDPTLSDWIAPGTSVVLTICGKSPAQILFAEPSLKMDFPKWNQQTGDHSMADPPNYGAYYDVPGVEQFNVQWLAPGDERFFTSFDRTVLEELVPEIKAEINGGQRRIYIYSAIKYRGMFSPKIFESRFCYGWSSIRGMFMAGPYGYNKYT